MRRVTNLLAIFIAVLCLVLSSVAFSEDWLMWRHDAAHTAATNEELPKDLHLQWRRQLPEPRPAFPERPRLCFDLSYEPVAMGNTLFVPSMVTDSVTALDADTGEEKWVFFAEAPVRFAPVAQNGKVYFVSDDGFLYCLDAEKGKLLWKFSAIPSGLEPYRLLGNGRMISRFPARGAPVLAEGVIYFASGFWSNEGVYVFAVNAETGKLIWKNGDGVRIENGLIDHGCRKDAGLSPLGYLAVLGDRVIVPIGRALPAFFDRKTGKMEPYTTGWGGRSALAKGSWYVCGIGDFYFHSGELFGLTPKAAAAAGEYELKKLMTFEELAREAQIPVERLRQYEEKGYLQIVERDGKRYIRMPKRELSYVSWAEPTFAGEKHMTDNHPRLQLDPADQTELGVFREPVLTPTAMYYSVPINNKRGRGGFFPTKVNYGEVVAYDITKPSWGLTCQGLLGARHILIAWKTLRFPELWRLPCELKVHIKAGSRLYAGAEGVVAAIEIPTSGGKPRISWRANIEGTPHSMLAANGKLFVVTKEGEIYCFGGAEVEPRVYKPKKPEPPAVKDEWVEKVATLLQSTGKKEGYCLVLGIGTGRLIEELARQSQMHIVVVEPDSEKVAAARRRLHALGLYGTRVHILTGDLFALRLPPYFASLIVTENAKAAGFDEKRSKAFVQEVFAPIRPYGGVACLPLDETERKVFELAVKETSLEGAEVSAIGGFTVLKRAGALSGSDDWTHESANAGNTFSSRDKLAKPPFNVLWFGGEIDRIFPPWDFTHCRGPFPLICRGRMFILVENLLHAIDIYTGRRLWTATLPSNQKTLSRRKAHMVTQRETADNFVAAEDTLYVISGDTCLKLNPADGSKSGEIKIPAGLGGKEPLYWLEVRIWSDYLVGAVGKYLVCLDRYSGKMLWEMESDRDRFSFALGNGKVFGVDYYLPIRRFRGEEQPRDCTVFAADIGSGRVIWKASAEAPHDTANDETRKRLPPLKPFLTYCEESDILILTATRSITSAYRGATGKQLWAKEISCWTPPSNFSGPEPPILLPDLLITHSGEVINPKTGKPVPRRLWHGMNTNWLEGGMRGCNRALANEFIVTLRDAHASYFDLATGKQNFFRSVRSGCTNNLIPAGGLLNAPNFSHGCACNWPLFMSYALAHEFVKKSAR